MILSIPHYKTRILALFNEAEMLSPEELIGSQNTAIAHRCAQIVQYIGMSLASL